MICMKKNRMVVMFMYVIDINADIGESFGTFKVGDDKRLIPYITSANIACGYHAGDHVVMDETIKLAKSYGVGIGAHPGYRDIYGFGRKKMDIPAEEIYQMIVYQIGAIQAMCHINDVKLIHVKPHGALYNEASVNREVARAIARAINDIDNNLILFALAGSELAYAGQELGLQVAQEAFADRMYTDKGTLVSRNEAHAVLHDEKKVEEQVLHIIEKQEVITETGNVLPMKAETLCFHGDNKNAIQLIKHIQSCLVAADISIKNVGG